MKINLSGLSAEILKTVSIEYSDSKDVNTLLEVLQSKSDILSNVKLYVSINDELATEQQIFNEKDEIFVFNPIAGG